MLTITGQDLSVRYSDIKNIYVAKVKCEVIPDNYVVSLRLTSFSLHCSFSSLVPLLKSFIIIYILFLDSCFFKLHILIADSLVFFYFHI